MRARQNPGLVQREDPVRDPEPHDTPTWASGWVTDARVPSQKCVAQGDTFTFYSAPTKKLKRLLLGELAVKFLIGWPIARVALGGAGAGRLVALQAGYYRFR